MTKRRFSTGFSTGRLGFSTLLLGLAIFGLAPSEAKAIQVMCSDEFGHCDVQSDPSFITCTCNNESSTGGTGGDEYQGLSEEELLAICAAELAFCTPEMDTGLDGGTSTFGTDGTGTSDGGDTGTSTSDGGTSTSDGGTSTSDGGESGTTAADSGGSEEGTGGDTSGTSGTTGDSGGETGTDGGGLTGAAEAGDEQGGTGTDDDDAALDEAKGCSVTDDSGLGALALFGMFGLLGLRSRKSTH